MQVVQVGYTGSEGDTQTAAWMGTESVAPKPRAHSQYFLSLLRTIAPLVFTDVLAIALAILTGEAFGMLFGVSLLGRWSLVALIPLATITCLVFFRAYPCAGKNPVFEFRLIGTAVSLTFVLLATFSAGHYPRGFLVALIIFFGVGIPCVFYCYVLRQLARRALGRTEWWGIRTLVIGCDEHAQRAFHTLRARPWLGMRPVGFVGRESSWWNQADYHVKQFFLGTLDDMRQVAEREGCYHAIVSLADGRKTFSTAEHSALCNVFPHVMIASSGQEFPSLWNETHEIGGVSCLSTKVRLMMPLFRVAKRCLDLGVVVLFCTLMWPLLLLLATLVKLSSPGQVLYGQERIGLQGQRFRAWKFRTMVADADQALREYLERNPALRDEWERDHKLRDDPRVTTVGKFLRASSLDELPQLWNVLVGEMSLVGPRPIVEAEVPKYSNSYWLYNRVRPGLTGLWQVSGRNNTTYDERVRLDCYYIRNWSLWLDLYILLRSLKTVVLREGAY